MYTHTITHMDETSNYFRREKERKREREKERERERERENDMDFIVIRTGFCAITRNIILLLWIRYPKLWESEFRSATLLFTLLSMPNVK